MHLVGDQRGLAAGPRTIERAARATLTQVGLSGDFRFHDLRHYFASLLIASGLDVEVVQARATPRGQSGATAPGAPKERTAYAATPTTDVTVSRPGPQVPRP